LPIGATMTGSWFRPKDLLDLVSKSPTGEVPPGHEALVEEAEREAIRDQLHPMGSSLGLTWVSNGEQRKGGYTYFLPNRFYGFSETERSAMPFPPSLLEEFQESNPQLVAAMMSDPSRAFALPKIEEKLRYHGEELARAEASAASRIARGEGAPRVFVPAPSPGVTTIFFPRTAAYRDHLEYLFGVASELRKEYQAILSVPGVDLQIDAPDLAMGKQTAQWGMDFYEALPKHVEAINEAVAGLPAERIRVHYCYGNWVGSHKYDADYGRVLPEALTLKVGTLVGEMANPRHEGDSLIMEEYLRDHEWPKGMKLAAGVIDVKTPIVETPQTVAFRLDRLVRTGKIAPESLLGGTDCGFETFAMMGNVTKAVALMKLRSLAEGAALESKRLGAE
jgi:5-methyltetrahydropteroyltriglutamate--homocysteine methyltransferase